MFNHRFGRIGAIVGTYPLYIFLSCLVLFLASISYTFIYPPIFRLNFDEGYTTKDAPSVQELKAQIGFFGNKGTPWYMALFAVPRDLEKGSMIESGEFDEFKQFYKSVKKDIVIREEGNKSITYMDYCGNMCDFNEVIFKTYSMAIFGLQWPETSIFTYKSNIGKYFFEREMKGDEIISSKMSALYFMVFVNSTSTANDLREFERKVTLKLEEHNADDSKLTTLIQHSARGMEMEIKRGTTMVAYKMALGLGLTAVLILVSLILQNKVHGRSTGRVFFLWIVAFLLPLMSLITATAFCCLLKRHFNTIMFVSPVAAFAVGLDGVFILYETWLRVSNQRREDVMLEVFGSCLPSITIINAAAIGLMAGGLFPIEEFANLSFFLSITIICTYIYQMFFFAPTMVWCSPVNSHMPLPKDIEKKCNGRSWWLTSVIDPYAQLLASPWPVMLAVVVFCFGCTLPAIFGFKQVHGNLDYRHLLPPDSPSNKGVHFISDVVWPEFLHILFIIEQPPNFSDPNEYREFKDMIAEIEELPGTIGKSSNMMWIKDFERYTDISENETSLNMSMFKDFITHDIYKAWNSGVQFRYEEDGTFIITRMLFMVGFEGTNSMSDKAVLMTNCRKVAAKYPMFNTIPFDTEVGMVDVILQIPQITYIVPIFIYIIMFALFVAFVGNLVVSVIVLMSAVSVYAGSYCISALFGMTLNPFSVAFLIFTATVSPKFCTHICYFFQQTLKLKGFNDDVYRLTDALNETLLPILLSSICGASLLLPVIFSNIVIFKFLAIINLLMLILGLFHSVVLVPIILIRIPTTLTGMSFFCSEFQQRDTISSKPSPSHTNA